jgi:polar amino acid transport system permease protein
MASINGKQRIEVTDGTLIPEKNEKSVFSAWRLTFFGAVILLVILPLIKPDPFYRIYQFILLPQVDLKFSPAFSLNIILPDGIITTFQVTLLAMFFSLIIGVFIGLGRISRVMIINRMATIYVEIIRGIPLLVQLFYIYYAMGKLVQLPPIMSAVIAMSVCYGAYIGEIFRAGIISIPKGQMEAAISLGMTRRQALWRIILPQTVKVVLPPIGNEFIAMLKDSSLVSILAVADLLRRGREFASKTFYYFETFTVIAVIYLILTLFFSRVVGIIEERVQKRGRK